MHMGQAARSLSRPSQVSLRVTLPMALVRAAAFSPCVGRHSSPPRTSARPRRARLRKRGFAKGSGVM